MVSYAGNAIAGREPGLRCAWHSQDYNRNNAKAFRALDGEPLRRSYQIVAGEARDRRKLPALSCLLQLAELDRDSVGIQLRTILVDMHHLLHAALAQVVVDVVANPGNRRAISSLANEKVIRILCWIQKPDHHSRHVNFPLMSRIVLRDGRLRYL